MKVVFASHNIGKINELQSLLADFSLEIIPLSELSSIEIEETACSFVENALIKARYACEKTGLPAIADDSGLSVKKLDGAPGIYSARYAGAKASNDDNINKLLLDLKNVPTQERTATFHCVLVYLAHAKDPTPLICHGQWHGEILTEKLGTNGFGYDPIFYIPSENKTAAELTKQEKNRLSHRAQALRQLIHLMQEKL
jgi:XTP/dITP diphosphohydrolase